MTRRKCHLKNDKVEHFLNDKNHTQIVSPGKTYSTAYGQDITEWKQLFLYLYLCIL